MGLMQETISGLPPEEAKSSHPVEKQVAGREQKRDLERFVSFCKILIRQGDELMASLNDAESKEPKVYHTSEHPKALQERAKRIADVLGLGVEQRYLIAIAISYHDAIINYTPPDPDDIVGTIQRHRGAREGDKPRGREGNEAKSADAMETAARRINEEAKRATGQAVFSDEDIRTLRWEIDATYPDVAFTEFEKDPFYQEIVRQNPQVLQMAELLRARGITKGLHFFQPHLENPLQQGERVPQEVLVVALSDLGAGGLVEKAGDFFAEGDNEFKELYHNLRNPENYRRLLAGAEERDRGDRAKVSHTIFNWLSSQPGFVLWQMIRFEKIMYFLQRSGELDAEQASGLRGLSGYYESNIKASLDREERMKNEYQHKLEAEGEREAFTFLALEMKLEGALLPQKS